MFNTLQNPLTHDGRQLLDPFHAGVQIGVIATFLIGGRVVLAQDLLPRRPRRYAW